MTKISYSAIFDCIKTETQNGVIRYFMNLGKGFQLFGIYWQNREVEISKEQLKLLNEIEKNERVYFEVQEGHDVPTLITKCWC